jgi:hypothetical protein
MDMANWLSKEYMCTDHGLGIGWVADFINQIMPYFTYVRTKLDKS